MQVKDSQRKYNWRCRH